MNKIFISAEELERDSWNFAVQMHETGLRFDWVVGVARGGAQISIYMQEAFCLFHGLDVNYATIQAWSYTAIGHAEDEIKIRHLATLTELVSRGQTMLVIDDVFDRGTTLKAIARGLAASVGGKGVKVSLAALYWKPDNNLTDIKPDYHYRTFGGDQWLVFPHELCGLSHQELAAKGFPVECLPQHD